jgi:ABC-type lipoprotein release transport system permease subunit
MMSLREPRDVPMAFGALAQSSMTGFVNGLRYVIRARDPWRIRPAALNALASVDPTLSVEFRTMADEALSTIQRERLLAWAGALFSALGVTMVIVGLYGTFAYAVVRRQLEIGVRFALGATRRSVIALITRDVAIAVTSGTAAGVAVVTAFGRSLETMLVGITTRDAATLTLAGTAVLVAALAATIVPARRAAGVLPSDALRAP